MNYSLKQIAAILKKARQDQGLSQRAFGLKVGVPQSHISKIENGQVDLQTSSLIEFSRALGLELMLVPRAFVPAVQALQRGLGKEAQVPAYRLEQEEDE